MTRKVLVVAAVGALSGLATASTFALGASSPPSRIVHAARRSVRRSTVRLAYGNVAIAEPAGTSGVTVGAVSIARCPRGMHAISGGWYSTSASSVTVDPVTITIDEASRDLRRWVVQADDTSSDDQGPGFKFQASALCG